MLTAQHEPCTLYLCRKTKNLALVCDRGLCLLWVCSMHSFAFVQDVPKSTITQIPGPLPCKYTTCSSLWAKALALPACTASRALVNPPALDMHVLERQGPAACDMQALPSLQRQPCLNPEPSTLVPE